jgi:hypothetical protein
LIEFGADLAAAARSRAALASAKNERAFLVREGRLRAEFCLAKVSRQSERSF